MNLDLFILISSAVINLLLLLTVLIKRKNNLKNPINATFILGVLFVLAWFLFNYLADSSTDISKALLWTRLTVPSSLLALWFILWFSYAFPVKTKNFSRKITIYFLLVVIFSVLATTDYIFKNVKLDKNAGISDINSGIFYPVMIGLYLLLAGNMFYNFYAKYKKLKGIFQTQIKYVLAGWFVFLLGAFVVSLILPYIFSNAKWSKFGPLFSIIMVGFTAYAIVRHQLMDIRVVIQRGAIYSTLLALIVGFYLTAIFVLETIFRKATNISVLISAGLTAVIGIFGVPYLERYFRRLTDKVFFKGKYEYPEAAYMLSEILNRNLELDALSIKAIQALKQIFRVGKVSLLLIPQNVFLSEEGEWQTASKHYSREFISELERNPEVLLCSEITRGQVNTIAGNERREVPLEIQKLREKCGTEVIVPLALEHRLVGILTMGKKLSGDSYTDDDVKLLKTFSCQAAVALEKAELYKRVQDYSRELEARVKQRTAEIQRLQEEQRQMMVDLSHGLQTPLTVIKGNLDFLKNQMPANKRIDTLHNATDKVSEFIYDLLKLAKLESSQEDFKKEPVDFSKLLRGIVEYVGVIAQEKQIGVVSHIKPSLKMYGQKDKLEELVANLISNAVKYTPDGGKIYIDLKKIDGIIAELAIRDTGIGIDKEDLPHIFERFYKIRSQDREHVRGTGLGLAICKRIVEKHGGTIEARSEPGKGTTFVVRFPLALQTQLNAAARE
jgi:signal transduction histidine kinase